MSVELCKVSLWMEALEPGKPLSFLDHHIKYGNSLIGATPVLIKNGIPDEAFNLVEGDDKEYCSASKKQNKKERIDYKSGQQLLTAIFDDASEITNSINELENVDDKSVLGIRKKEELFNKLKENKKFLYEKLIADAWCSAFMWEKKRSNKLQFPITERVFRDIQDYPDQTIKWMKDEINRLAKEYQFFHWHLEFPDVFIFAHANEKAENAHCGWNGGFDCVIGNPPWESMQLEEKQFFSTRDNKIANLLGENRKDVIKNLNSENPTLAKDFFDAKYKINKRNNFIRFSNKFPLTTKGKMNTYTLFTEESTTILSKRGKFGIVIPTGIATDDSTKVFFAHLIKEKLLIKLIGFENEEFLFPGIANVIKYCILIITGQSIQNLIPQFAFYIRNIQQIMQRERYFNLNITDFELLNPNTLNCPIFRTKYDAELTKKLYKNIPIIFNKSSNSNPWGIKFLQGLFNSTSDSKLFYSKKENNDYLPLYESKLFWHFDHRFSSYDMKGTEKGKGGRGLPEMSLKNYQNPDYKITPQYWVTKNDIQNRIPPYWSWNWLIAFRKVTSAKLERTAVFTIIPYAGLADSAQLVFLDKKYSAFHAACFLANVNCFIFDYIVRQKIGGVNLNFYIMEQLPVLPPDIYTQEAIDFIAPRVLELIYTANDLRSFAVDMNFNSFPFTWEETRRYIIRAELDAYYSHLYKISRDELSYILDPVDIYGNDFPGETFRVLKEKEIAIYSEYRTKKVILEIYDEMKKATESGTEYKTRLNPPPGDVRASHGQKQQKANIISLIDKEPFIRVEKPAKKEKHITCIPSFTLKAAAGYFDNTQEPQFDTWVKPNTNVPLKKGLIVVQVTGKSMEPEIPDGAWCIFSWFPVPSPKKDKIYIFQYHNYTDPESGGSYTVKRFNPVYRKDDDDWAIKKIELVPVNSEFNMISIKEENSGDLKVIAELIEVLK
ncbi:MAG: hypothetical protein A2096_11790 [Spirochaetes bacterium GWF1_41_5]|nr:MAG: hypothetical protein A2096_11790 [Spirochaetes bacterium GWF1_41_5]HBE03128.1 hypothetical protein [Spirochaetia bacterium]